MNCPQCNAELSDGATFCPQCASPTAGKPIFPPDPAPHQPAKQNIFLIAFACALTAFVVVMFVGFSVDDRPGNPGKPATSTDFSLYGKTIQNQDFDWESLQGKYVLVKFTATWCGPCQMEIPGMLEAYEKYHDKGLEIVSIYIGEREPNAVETVKNYIKEKKLPWIILSESLTVKAGQPPQGKAFDIQGVPTMLLVDKEGNVLVHDARGEILRRELKKLFE